MQSFEEIEQLIADLEAGEISNPDAIRRIEAARVMLKRLHDSLGNIRAGIMQNPLFLRQARTERLTEALFDRAKR